MSRPMSRAIIVGLIVAATVFVTAVLATAQATVSPLETAQLEALAARQEVMVLQGKLALAEQTYGACAAIRGQLEMLVSKAVIDAKQAGFLRQYEIDHPGLTWDFARKGPVKKDGR